MQRSLRGNRLIGVLLAFSYALGLAGCGGDKSRAIEETRRNLKDPDSAKFGEVVFVDNGDKDRQGKALKGACVTVNAKNAFGGYTGDQQATLIFRGKEIDYLGSDDLSQDMCLQIVKGTLAGIAAPTTSKP